MSLSEVYKSLITRVVAPKAIAAKSKTEITVDFTNNSAVDVSILRGSSISQVIIDIRSADGKKVKKTKKGETVLTRSNEGDQYSSGPSLTVKPGKSYQWKTDIAELFELPAGDYRLSASLSACAAAGGKIDEREVTSEVIQFTVK